MIAIVGVGAFAACCHAQQLQVVGTAPARHVMAAPGITSISIEFNRPVDPASVTPQSVWAFGRLSGMVMGTLSVSGSTVTLSVPEPFTPGEVVTVYMSQALRGADLSPMRTGGHTFQFWVRARPARIDWQFLGSITTRTIPTQTTRCYGGVASDLDNDGWIDMTTVHEDTADLRIFMNQGTGAGSFDPFLQPPSPVGDRASPSETGDFDRDGNIDVCVANINANTVSVLLGNDDFFYYLQVFVGGC